jgi:hypothetical protein
MGLSSPPSRLRLVLLIGLVILCGCRRSTEVAPSTQMGGSPAAQAQRSPTIKADPNPVPAGPEKLGKTTISWDTGDGKPGQVYLSVNGGAEKRFTGARARGSQEAPWIGAKGEYEFRLYAGKEHTNQLASVRVTQSK